MIDPSEALLVYVDAVADMLDPNPDRPTEAGYCAQCGMTPCTSFSYLDRHDGGGCLSELARAGCIAEPGPETERFLAAQLLYGDDAKTLFPTMTGIEVLRLLVRAHPWVTA